jgi:hypothetical protein
VHGSVCQGISRPLVPRFRADGHEYAQCQLGKEGIGFKALDNGFVSCEDHDRLQTICEQMGPEQIDALLRRWLAKLPHPFTPQDREAGYRYDLSILQAEFSLTQILDRPLSGRLLFEEIIRENLDLGRPDRVQLIFDRRVTKRTPGRFRTRVLTDGVMPRPQGYLSPDKAGHSSAPVVSPLCGRSAFKPTDVFSKSNVSARTAPSEKKRC